MIIIVGYKICKSIFEVYLPKKYAVGEYILFASSLLMTGAYKGIYKITLILPLKLS
jgi:hypothetical protein